MTSDRHNLASTFSDSKGDDRFVPMHDRVAPIINRRLTNDRLFGDDWINKDQLYGERSKRRGQPLGCPIRKCGTRCVTPSGAG